MIRDSFQFSSGECQEDEAPVDRCFLRDSVLERLTNGGKESATIAGEFFRVDKFDIFATTWNYHYNCDYYCNYYKKTHHDFNNSNYKFNNKFTNIFTNRTNNFTNNFTSAHVPPG